MKVELENKNPNVYNTTGERSRTADEEDDDIIDEFDTREIFGNNYYRLHYSY